MVSLLDQQLQTKTTQLKRKRQYQRNNRVYQSNTFEGLSETFPTERFTQSLRIITRLFKPIIRHYFPDHMF